MRVPAEERKLLVDATEQAIVSRVLAELGDPKTSAGKRGAVELAAVPGLLISGYQIHFAAVLAGLTFASKSEPGEGR